MKKRLLSLVLALGMVFTMGTTAVRAADETPSNGPTDLAEAVMVKKLNVADGIDISDVKDFKFSFTAVASDTAPVADVPAIADQTISVGEQKDDVALGTLALSDLFKIDDFKHAGEYTYTVKETTVGFDDKDDTADKVEKLVVDKTEYTVIVLVVNGKDGLEFAGVLVKKGDEKVDPTITDGTGGFLFENTYTEVLEPDNEDGALKITKTITGDYADKTKKFPVSVELKLPSTATAADVAVAEGVTLSGTTASADLADGGTIVFTKLPAGTTFVVKETQDQKYKSKVTGFVKTVDTDYVAGNVEKEGKEAITEPGKTVEIENNLASSTPTGVIINNLPYMLLIVIAAAGIAFFWMKKRSRA